MMTVLEHILQLRLNIGVYHIDTKRKANYLKVEVFSNEHLGFGCIKGIICGTL